MKSAQLKSFRVFEDANLDICNSSRCLRYLAALEVLAVI